MSARIIAVVAPLDAFLDCHLGALLTPTTSLPKADQRFDGRQSFPLDYALRRTLIITEPALFCLTRERGEVYGSRV